MLTLTYGRFSFTSEDIHDTNADPPITYTATTIRGEKWRQAASPIWDSIDEDNEKTDITTKEAITFLGIALLEIEQNGNAIPINGPESVQEVRDTVQELAGYGDEYIKQLAIGTVVVTVNRELERKKKLQNK